MVTYRDGQTIGSQWIGGESSRLPARPVDHYETGHIASSFHCVHSFLSFPSIFLPFFFFPFFCFSKHDDPTSLSLSFSCGILDWKVEVSRATPSRQLWRPPRDVSCAYPHETGAGAIVGNVQLKMNEPMGSESAPLDRSQPRLKRDRRMIVT